MDERFELRVSGPVALWRDGRPVGLRSRKALALLVLLALDGPRPREWLAELLWPDLDVASSRRNLRRELFRLRDLGVRFDDQDPQRLALAGGMATRSGDATPLEGLEGCAGDAFDDWLRQRRTRQLTERRRTLLALAVDHDREDRVELALSIWNQLLDADPCDEDALLPAMQALARRGEPARALGLYWKSAAAMHERLGAAPSAATRALAGSLRAPAPAALPLFAECLPFVPRVHAGTTIMNAWQRRLPVWLGGASGVGKTRLAQACAAASGAWLCISCLPADRAQPFATVVRLLRTLRAAAPDVRLPDWARREVSQLLPELGPPPQSMATTEARARLLAGINTALSLLVADNFGALVLDDWQWVDDDSAAIWSAFDPQALPLAQILCFRSGQLPPAALAHLRREVDAARAVRIDLEGFSGDETLALLHALSSSTGGQLFARRLQRITAGNPFFLIETLRHLHQQALLRVDPQGRWSTPFDADTADYAELPVPSSVRDAVRARVRALGPLGMELLDAASVHNDAIDVALLAETTGRDAVEVLPLLTHAAAARLLDDRDGHWNFSHDLVRQCLADGQSPHQRRQWHHRLGATLESRGADPALVAQHYEQAGEPSRAVPLRLRAGDAAWRLHALEQAAEQWRAALADGPSAEQAVQAHLSLAALHRRKADPAAARMAIDLALEAAAQAPAAARLRARLSCAEQWVGANQADLAGALLDAVEADLVSAPPRDRARALNLRATIAAWAGRHDEAVRLFEAAFAVLEGVEDALVDLGIMLDSAARSLIVRGRSREAQAFARRAVATLEAAGEPTELAAALVIDGVCRLHVQGDAGAARERFERARALAQRCGLVPTQRAAILNMIKLHTDAGHSTEALALLAQGEALAPGFEHAAAEQAFLQARYFVHYLRGEIDAAGAAAQRLVAQARGVSDEHILCTSLAMVSDLAIHTRRHPQAEALLSEAAALIEADPGNGNHVLVGAKRAWLALEQGQVARARALLPPADLADRAEARLHCAWVAAAVALAEGHIAEATKALRRHPPATEGPTNIVAMLLVQHLALARRRGRRNHPAVRRAQALLAAGALPALEAQRLRAAVDALLINAGSTRSA